MKSEGKSVFTDIVSLFTHSHNIEERRNERKRVREIMIAGTRIGIEKGIGTEIGIGTEKEKEKEIQIVILVVEIQVGREKIMTTIEDLTGTGIATTNTNNLC